jgi:acetylornithine deacetylase/succinyl-diaminopimelate desuccinylase-like protein
MRAADEAVNLEPPHEYMRRTARLLFDTGEAGTLQGADQILAAESIAVAVDEDLACRADGQAALLTAVNAAARAVGQVRVVLPANATHVALSTPGHRGCSVVDAITRLGGVVSESPGAGPVIAIGAPQLIARGTRAALAKTMVSSSSDAQALALPFPVNLGDA